MTLGLSPRAKATKLKAMAPVIATAIQSITFANRISLGVLSSIVFLKVADGSGRPQQKVDVKRPDGFCTRRRLRGASRPPKQPRVKTCLQGFARLGVERRPGTGPSNQ